MHSYSYALLTSPILLATTVAIAQGQLRPGGSMGSSNFGSLGAAAVTAAPQSQQDPGSSAGPFLVGAGLGILGGLAGVGAGMVIAHGTECFDVACTVPPVLLGVGGLTFGIALGVHLGNRRRGDFGLDLLTAVAILLVAAGVPSLVSGDLPLGVVLLTTPLAQLVGTVVVERAVGRARAQRRGLTVSVVPQGAAGAGLRVSVSFENRMNGPARP